MKLLKCAAAVALIAMAAPSSALVITADYSILGTVYQDNTTHLLSNAFSANSVDVTSSFKANVGTAIQYWDNAILLPYATTITFKLFTLINAVGDSSIATFDANGRPTSSTIRVDNSVVPFYVDATPTTNTEFGIVSTSAPLGGASVNVGRIGDASTTAAGQGYDLLSLLLHEIEHSIGFSSQTTRFDAAVSNGGTTLVIPSSVTGLPSSYVVPIDGTHIDGTANGGLFNDTSIALPGFNGGQRALLTAVDIQAICTIEGCAPNQMNTNPSAFAPSAVPEPETLALLGLGVLSMMGLSRRRRTLDV